MTSICLVAGEASGDLLGADLAQSILQQYPNTKLFGMAGPKMRAAGVEALVDAETMAIVGIWEIIKHLGKIKRSMRCMQLALLERTPDVIILIDYPGFNLRIADFAHRHGIKVLYYVSPQIWAWRSGRINHIKQIVDHMAVLFPFEKKIYRQAGVPVTVVGHPLTHIVPQDVNTTDCKQKLGLDCKKTVVGLLPGSRRQEIDKLLPTMLAAAAILKQKKPDLQCVLPIASGLNKRLFNDLPDYVQCIEDDTYTAIKACDAVICTSGTATLEVSLLEVPMVLIYKVAPFSYWLGKKLIKTPYIGLCNIIAEKMVCQELIQHDANAEKISQEILQCLDDKTYRENMLNEMAHTLQRLGGNSQNNALLRVTEQYL
ncbi:MAG: lipid-A-disaccharide synthase [Coxiellaceae bacterium]|nr:lipid-A-disaccharide synthase [Coxiellaceae bacterium]